MQNTFCIEKQTLKITSKKRKHPPCYKTWCNSSPPYNKVKVEWTNQSPDPNIIGNLWQDLKLAGYTVIFSKLDYAFKIGSFV